MTQYQDSRVRRLSESLAAADTAPEIVDEIMEGGEAVSGKDASRRKAAWFMGAMERMDRLIGLEERKAVREACACCLGGKRRQLSRAIARENGTLEERIAAAAEAKLVFGDHVWREEDGSVWVRFHPEGQDSYRCPCLPDPPGPMPVTYCLCCGGHAKHHLQIALGRALDVTVVHTALSTGGRKPCTFRFDLRD